jgi:hypothetical protein
MCVRLLLWDWNEPTTYTLALAPVLGHFKYSNNAASCIYLYLYTITSLRFLPARNALAYTSARGIGFCVIWVCISSSSSSSSVYFVDSVLIMPVADNADNACSHQDRRYLSNH